MSPKPLFSVLIANYNDGRYLTKAIESVLAQSYNNWEIIIVDDCSSDNSMDVIGCLDNPRIHVYLNDKNYGCGYTKRRCVELSHGEICGFLDADDQITEDALETMVNAHIENPTCSLIYSNFYYANNDLSIISISDHQCNIPEGKSFLTCNIPGAISHFSTFKKEFYQKTEGIADSLRIAEDLDLYFKLEEVGKTLFIPKPLYFYRTHTGNNTSLGYDKRGQALGWEILARYAACKRRGLPINQHSFFPLEKTLNELEYDSYMRGVESIRKTKAYQLGRIFLHPIKWLMHKNNL